MVGASILFLRPQDDPLPTHADAVVVLAGDTARRLPVALRLMRDGRAETLVVSRDTGLPGRPGRQLCSRPPKAFRVVCFSADPYNTRGEAQEVGRLADAHAWRSLVVVTSDYHLYRARLLFRRCVDGDLAFRGAGYERSEIPKILALETAKLVRAETQRGC